MTKGLSFPSHPSLKELWSSNYFTMKRLAIVVMSFVLHFGSHHAKERVLQVPGLGEVTFTESAGNMNDYLDQVITGATDKFEEYKMDPLILPDAHHTIQHKVWFINLKGGVQTSNGVVRGLKSLHRARDATLRVDDESKVMQLDGSLGARNLHISTNIYAWYSFLKVNIQATGTVDYLRASLELELPLDGEEFKPKATYVVVNDIDGFKLSVKGLGPLNWLAERIVGLVIGDIRNFINGRFGQMALNAINAELGKLSRPDFIPLS